MTEREAYDRLARSSTETARRAGRLLARGDSVIELATRLAQPQAPPASEPFVTPACAGFPPLLKTLSPVPLRLFHRGQPLDRLSGHCVAVVGSRQASRYGLNWSHRLGAALARRGISVCSGLAVGIDAAAHRGALEVAMGEGSAGVGVPVGVLGHGFEHAYPPQNQRLRYLLEQHGILLTEYPPSFPPARWTFPERNRIIAGMCQAVVVVEAGPRSGSLHTARFANEAGRDVWVVPNRPGTPNSAGVLSLLRDGANPMVSLQEFLDQLQADLGRTHPLAEGVAQPQALPESLVPFLLALAGDEQATPSMLCQTLECSPPLLAERLAELEIRGVVQRRFDGCWEVVRWELVEQALQMGWQRDPQGIT